MDKSRESQGSGSLSGNSGPSLNTTDFRHHQPDDEKKETSRWDYQRDTKHHPSVENWSPESDQISSNQTPPQTVQTQETL